MPERDLIPLKFFAPPSRPTPAEILARRLRESRERAVESRERFAALAEAERIVAERRRE